MDVKLSMRIFFKIILTIGLADSNESFEIADSSESDRECSSSTESEGESPGNQLHNKTLSRNVSV